MSVDASRGRTPGGSSRRAWVLGGYNVDACLDWACVLLAAVVLAAAEAGTPRAGYVPKALIREGTAYPLRADSVPAWTVPVYTLVAPAVVYVLHSVMLRRPAQESQHLVLGSLMAVLVTAAVTNLIKCPVGRLRPDFNARCWPSGQVAWQREDEWGGYPACSGDPRVVAEGRKSFPSGHSSWSAAGLCFLSLWLADRLRPFDGAGHAWRLLAAAGPALAALAVGISRVVDYKHNPSDVAAGLLLGASIAWVCYRQQRARLAELDPVSYGSSTIGAGGPDVWAAGSGGGGGGRGMLLLGEDGMPLLSQQQQQQQSQSQQLPV